MTDAALTNGSRGQAAETGAASYRRPDLSEARLRKRYRAERRFQIFGALAIGIAAAVLLILLGRIVTEALPAFSQNYIDLQVELPREEIDPDGTDDPAVLARARYGTLINNALYERFPNVSGRTDRRALRALVSSEASETLRADVLADPSIIGTTHSVWVKSSADVDVYRKGLMSDFSRQETNGIASIIEVDGITRVLSTSNDFAEILDSIKQELGDLAEGLQIRVTRLDRGVAAARDQLATASKALADAQASGAAEDVVDRLQNMVAQAEASLASLQERRSQVKEQIDDYEARSARVGGAEALTEQLPSYLIEMNGGLLKIVEISNTEATVEPLVPPRSDADAPAGTWDIFVIETPESQRRLPDREAAWVWSLEQSDQIETRFNISFFTDGNSREPEQAGIWGAVVGSFLTLVITLLLSFPIGVLAAVYLEEFAPKNRWTDLIEVNINNLAAVPSIVFGLLGLAVFLNFFELPRSAPVVGGMVLALMTLPTIIIASRAALTAVPPSIREAALGMGASKLQVMTHHVLPLAMPGILTGTIIGMAQALGETAPLLMIGMVAFVVDIPGGFTDPASVLPVQIFMWADLPERAFVAKTSAAIMVLLGFLILMNALAVLLRKRFERRW